MSLGRSGNTVLGLQQRQWTWLAALASVALPLLLSNYQVFLVTTMLIVSVALLGLNVLFGYNGQVSLGHGAFYGIGAYAAAILITHGSVPYPAAVLVAAVLCLILGALFGLPALRLAGPYLALATFALAVAVPQLLKYRAFEPFTGGVQGMAIDKPNAPFGLPLHPDHWLYFLVLAITGAIFAITANLLRGRTGTAFIAIRDNPIAAASMGIDVARYKTVAFAISAMYAGLAGALGALVTQFVAPDDFTLFLSLGFFVGVVVGGLGTISGALFGALFLVLAPNFADQLSKSATWGIYGVMLLICLYIAPRGIGGLIDFKRRSANNTTSRNLNDG